MPNRIMIISTLLPAYMLLVLHSVIPHHHHAPMHEGPLQYHHGYATPDHTHHEHEGATKEDDHHEDHDHTAHFVHSPEFGNAMMKPGIKWIDLPESPIYNGCIQTAMYLWWPAQSVIPRLRPPEKRLSYPDPAMASGGLRGPPDISIV